MIAVRITRKCLVRFGERISIVGKKTVHVMVYDVMTDEVVGFIVWGDVRQQYVFLPRVHTKYGWKFLVEIIEQLRVLNAWQRVQGRI